MLKKRQLSQKQLQQHNTVLGASGEAQAAAFLTSHTYTILETNVRVATHEVDIIALDTEQDELVFCEVKTRSTAYFGDPSSAVTRKKVQSMARVAVRYCAQKKIHKPYRFDVLTVLPSGVEHYKNITW